MDGRSGSRPSFIQVRELSKAVREYKLRDRIKAYFIWELLQLEGAYINKVPFSSLY
jgi:hypothetical protein